MENTESGAARWVIIILLSLVEVLVVLFAFRMFADILR
jgi:hypothetical protein